MHLHSALMSIVCKRLFRTAVILTSGASVPGALHHNPCIGSGGSGSSPAVPIMLHAKCKNWCVRSRVI